MVLGYSRQLVDSSSVSKDRPGLGFGEADPGVGVVVLAVEQPAVLAGRLN